MSLEIYTFLNKFILNAQWWLWRESHTVQDFETRMIESGCTKVHTRNSVIFNTPNGLGKIEVTDTEIIINP